MRFCSIHMRGIAKELLKILVHTMSLKITLKSTGTSSRDLCIKNGHCIILWSSIFIEIDVLVSPQIVSSRLVNQPWWVTTASRQTGASWIRIGATTSMSAQTQMMKIKNIVQVKEIINLLYVCFVFSFHIVGMSWYRPTVWCWKTQRDKGYKTFQSCICKGPKT